MVGYGLPVVLALPSALLLDDPLIGVSDDAVLLVDRNNHLSTSKLSRHEIYTIMLRGSHYLDFKKFSVISKKVDSSGAFMIANCQAMLDVSRSGLLRRSGSRLTQRFIFFLKII